MRLTTKRGAVARAFAGLCRGRSSPLLAPQRRSGLKGTGMPRKGYRKGRDDDRTPVPRFVRTRLPEALHARLLEEARERNLTHSALVRAIVAHYFDRRPVPKPRAVGATYAVARELNRIGVNLNQIAHLANATRIVREADLHRLVADLRAKLEML